MIPLNPDRDPDDALRELVRDPRLDAALSSSRTRTDARWVEISHRVRTRALQVTRRSMPITARAPSGQVQVSTQVLIAYVRDALAGVPGARVEDLIVAAGPDGAFTGLTIVISAPYGEPVIPLADALRDRATQRLGELLGDVTPPVTVTTMEVHVDDVHVDEVDQD